MGDREFDLCGYCCEWFRDTEGKSPVTVRDTYPKMMRRVLKEHFHLPHKAARKFVDEACYGNWDRFHLTRLEKEASAEDVAESLRYDVFYISDRLSWDRVIRVQWLYQVLRDKCRREEER